MVMITNRFLFRLKRYWFKDGSLQNTLKKLRSNLFQLDYLLGTILNNKFEIFSILSNISRDILRRKQRPG